MPATLASAVDVAPRAFGLTEREHKALQLSRLGFGLREIAAGLQLTSPDALGVLESARRKTALAVATVAEPARADREYRRTFAAPPEHFAERPLAPAPESVPWSGIPERRAHVARLLAEGYTHGTIALALGVSRPTVALDARLNATGQTWPSQDPKPKPAPADAPPPVVRLDAEAHALAERIVDAEKRPKHREALVRERADHLRQDIPDDAVRAVCGLCGHALVPGQRLNTGLSPRPPTRAELREQQRPAIAGSLPLAERWGMAS